MDHSPQQSRDPGDDALLAQLATDPSRAEAWRQLALLADDFASSPQVANDVRPRQGPSRADGVVVNLGFSYSRRVEQARVALAEVRAVTPAYPWMDHRPPAVPDDGSPLAPADAVRLATRIVRGERFSDGTIAQAVENGTLQAVLTSLAAWHAARQPG